MSSMNKFLRGLDHGVGMNGKSWWLDRVLMNCVGRREQGFLQVFPRQLGEFLHDLSQRGVFF